MNEYNGRRGGFKLGDGSEPERSRARDSMDVRDITGGGTRRNAGGTLANGAYYGGANGDDGSYYGGGGGGDGGGGGGGAGYGHGMASQHGYMNPTPIAPNSCYGGSGGGVVALGSHGRSDEQAPYGAAFGGRVGHGGLWTLGPAAAAPHPPPHPHAPKGYDGDDVYTRRHTFLKKAPERELFHPAPPEPRPGPGGHPRDTDPLQPHYGPMHGSPPHPPPSTRSPPSAMLMAAREGTSQYVPSTMRNSDIADAQVGSVRDVAFHRQMATRECNQAGDIAGAYAGSRVGSYGPQVYRAADVLDEATGAVVRRQGRDPGASKITHDLSDLPGARPMVDFGPGPQNRKMAEGQHRAQPPVTHQHSSQLRTEADASAYVPGPRSTIGQILRDPSPRELRQRANAEEEARQTRRANSPELLPAQRSSVGEALAQPQGMVPPGLRWPSPRGLGGPQPSASTSASPRGQHGGGGYDSYGGRYQGGGGYNSGYNGGFAEQSGEQQQQQPFQHGGYNGDGGGGSYGGGGAGDGGNGSYMLRAPQPQQNGTYGPGGGYAPMGPPSGQRVRPPFGDFGEPAQGRQQGLGYESPRGYGSSSQAPNLSTRSPLANAGVIAGATTCALNTADRGMHTGYQAGRATSLRAECGSLGVPAAERAAVIYPPPWAADHIRFQDGSVGVPGPARPHIEASQRHPCGGRTHFTFG